MGATRKLVLSPTPPVECLSTATLPRRGGREPFVGVAHGEGEGAGFVEREAAQKGGHEPGGELFGGNGAGGCAGDEEADLAVVERAAVAFFADEVDGVKGGGVRHYGSGLVSSVAGIIARRGHAILTRCVKICHSSA